MFKYDMGTSLKVWDIPIQGRYTEKEISGTILEYWPSLQ